MIAVSRHQGTLVVRDDLTPGGTKTRAIATLLEDTADDVAYAGPAYGYAQVALAVGARAAGKTAHVFVARRKHRHPRTLEASDAGARIHELAPGYLSQLQHHARTWAEANGATVLPFGFDTPAFAEALAADISDDLRSLPDPPADDADLAERVTTLTRPREVWVAAGSGTISRALQRVWPEAEHHAVAVGKTVANPGRATLHEAPERFEDDARQPPPYPSTSNYDAKVWQFVAHRPDPAGRLVWNVAG